MRHLQTYLSLYSSILILGYSIGMQAAEINADLTARLDAAVETTYNEIGLPGISVAITKDDEIVYSKNIAIEDSARFHVASLSKSITGLAIMQLVEQGKLGLDDDFKIHLPWFQSDATNSLDISIRQLLNQNSGISPRAGNHWSNPGRSLKDEIETYSDLELIAAPGEAFAYSNINYNILGAIVEEISGTPFTNYVEDRIFAPLQMSDSDFDNTVGLATGHSRFLGMQIPQKETIYFNNYSPSAGVVSTAADMSRYMSALMDPAKMQTGELLGNGSLRDFFNESYAIEDGESYAMGLYQDELHGRTIYYHDGGYSGFASRLLLVPNEKLGIIILTNTLLLTGDNYFQSLPTTLASLMLGDTPESLEADFSYLMILATFFILIIFQSGRIVFLLRRIAGAGALAQASHSSSYLFSTIGLGLLVDTVLIYFGLIALPSELAIGLRSMHLFILDFAVLLAVLMILSVILWISNLTSMLRLWKNRKQSQVQFS